MRLVHGLRDKEPQEIPIPPYSPARKVVVTLENRVSEKTRALLRQATRDIFSDRFSSLQFEHVFTALQII